MNEGLVLGLLVVGWSVVDNLVGSNLDTFMPIYHLCSAHFVPNVFIKIGRVGRYPTWVPMKIV